MRVKGVAALFSISFVLAISLAAAQSLSGGYSQSPGVYTFNLGSSSEGVGLLSISPSSSVAK